MSRLTVTCEQDRGVQYFIVAADLASGWKRRKSGICFYGQYKEEFQGDDQLVIKLWVDEHLPALAHATGVFPLELSNGPGRDGFFLRDGQLCVPIVLDAIRRGRRGSNEPGIDEWVHLGQREQASYRFRLFASLTQRQPGPKKWIERDLLPFPSAGLPELGKRR
jgi:hypothetical protein